MLRNFENIWSKNLVNSEEVTIFDVPNIYSHDMLCLYISKNSQYSGVSSAHNSSGLWMFGDIWGGSASSFVKNIINQIFSCKMPNITKDLKPGDNSTLTSTQPSEKGKSTNKLLKQIASFQQQVIELQSKLDIVTARFYHREFYISRNHSFGFSLFEKSNPVDKCDWRKLYEAEMRLKEAEK